MVEEIPFTTEHEEMLTAIHRDISELKSIVGDAVPQVENMLKSGPLAMIAGSLFRKP